MTKALILDSGTLINFSMNGLLYLLEKLKYKFNGKFLITEEVKYETIDRPSEIQRYELGALEIKNLLDSKIIELPEALGIDTNSIKQRIKGLMDTANHYLKLGGHWINLVSEAEMSCLALSDELVKKRIDNIITIDERTTRMLAENPENLEKLMSEKMHQKVEIVEQNMSLFARYKFIRSSELVYVAYKKNLINLKGKNLLEALLYATKFKGCSISYEEIEELKKL